MTDEPQGANRRLRELVAASWQRSAAAGVHPDGARLPSGRIGPDELAGHRAGHPLTALLPMIRQLLGEDSADDRHLAADRLRPAMNSHPNPLLQQAVRGVGSRTPRS